MNSDMVEYVHLSPNHSGKRTRAIDRITPHCVVGQLDAVTLGDWFSHASTQASCNYAIDRDGRVALIVDEDNRSWCSASNANDQRAVTIECASGKTSPYAFTDIVYQTLVSLCVDICRRNGKTKLLWISDKDQALNYEPEASEMLLTVHRWFCSTDCPGEWMMENMGDLAQRVTARLDALNEGRDASEDGQTATRTSGADLARMSHSEVAEVLKALAKKDEEKSGILSSITCAQAILESGYCKSELATKANNLFGMKASLSGNTWAGSVWDGSTYSKATIEYDETGTAGEEIASFRRYKSLEESIADHSAYLLGARNGSKLRYAGIKDEDDFWTVANLLYRGGYATDPQYPNKLLAIAKEWGLLDPGKTIEPAPKEATEDAVPFLVRVSISDLRIRYGPGPWYEIRGYIPRGVYTIVEVKDGWGRLKSGAGWISLDYVERV